MLVSSRAASICVRRGPHDVIMRDMDAVSDRSGEINFRAVGPASCKSRLMTGRRLRSFRWRVWKCVSRAIIITNVGRGPAAPRHRAINASTAHPRQREMRRRDDGSAVLETTRATSPVEATSSSSLCSHPSHLRLLRDSCAFG